MIKKSTIIVVGVLAVLIVAFILLNNRTPEPVNDLPTPTAPEMLKELDDQKLSKIIFKQIDLDTIEFKKIDTLEWTVTTHPEGQITAGKIEELLSIFSNVRILSTLNEPPRTSEIGLEEPLQTIVFEFEDSSTYTIEIGIASPINDGYYARIDGEKIVILPITNINQAVNIFTAATISPTPTPDPEATVELPDESATQAPSEEE